MTSGLPPYVAKRVYPADTAGLGWLVASFSFGALLGSMVMVVRGEARSTIHSERSMLVNTAIWYLALFGFGDSTTMSAGLVALLIAASFRASR